MWVYGGYRYANHANDMDDGSGFIEDSQDFVRYNLDTNEWEEVPVESMKSPKPRYSHSAVVYNVS